MPYSAEHTQSTRQRILQAAAKLFCSYGFDAVTLGQIMKQARMTHGAFYAHFAGKGALYEEALKFAASRAFWARDKMRKSAWDMNVKALVARYLGKTHVSLERCLSPMAFLITDASHKDEQVRRAYQDCYFTLVDNLATIMERKGFQQSREIAEEIIIRLVGTVTIARSIAIPSLQTEFLKRARKRLIAQLESHEIMV